MNIGAITRVRDDEEILIKLARVSYPGPANPISFESVCLPWGGIVPKTRAAILSPMVSKDWLALWGSGTNYDLNAIRG